MVIWNAKISIIYNATMVRVVAIMWIIGMVVGASQNETTLNHVIIQQCVEIFHRFIWSVDWERLFHLHYSVSVTLACIGLIAYKDVLQRKK